MRYLYTLSGIISIDGNLFPKMKQYAGVCRIRLSKTAAIEFDNAYGNILIAERFIESINENKNTVKQALNLPILVTKIPAWMVL